MALLFIDSFDHYQSADFLKKWTSGAGDIEVGAGRCGSNALKVLGPDSLDRGLTFTGNVVVCGFAWRQTSGVSLGGSPMVSFQAFQGAVGSIARNADGSISWGCSPGGLPAITVFSEPNLLHMDTW